METSLINPLIELEKLGNVLGSQPITFNAFSIARQVSGYAEKIEGSVWKSYMLLHLIDQKFSVSICSLKAKLDFVSLFFPQKKYLLSVEN